MVRVSEVEQKTQWSEDVGLIVLLLINCVILSWESRCPYMNVRV